MPDVKLEPADFELVFEEQRDDKGLVTDRKLVMVVLSASGRRKLAKTGKVEGITVRT